MRSQNGILLIETFNQSLGSWQYFLQGLRFLAITICFFHTINFCWANGTQELKNRSCEQTIDMSSVSSSLDRMLVQAACLTEPADQEICTLAAGLGNRIGINSQISKLKSGFKEVRILQKQIAGIEADVMASRAKLAEFDSELGSQSFGATHQNERAVLARGHLKAQDLAEKNLTQLRTRLEEKMITVASQRAALKSAARAVIAKGLKGAGTALLLYEALETAYHLYRDKTEAPTPAADYKTADGLFRFMRLPASEKCQLLAKDPSLVQVIANQSKAVDEYFADRFPKRATSHCNGPEQMVSLLEFPQGEKMLLKLQFSENGKHLKSFKKFPVQDSLSPTDELNFNEERLSDRVIYSASLNQDQPQMTSSASDSQVRAGLENGMRRDYQKFALALGPLLASCRAGLQDGRTKDRFVRTDPQQGSD